MAVFPAAFAVALIQFRIRKAAIQYGGTIGSSRPILLKNSISGDAAKIAAPMGRAAYSDVRGVLGKIDVAM